MSGEKAIDMKSKTPLAVGAAVGGVFGKQMFSAIKLCFAHEDAVTAVQSLCLAIITIGTLLYTLNKRKIRTHYLKSAAVCVMIGFLLGMSSSFLGIGGGIVGRAFNRRMKNAAVDRLFIGLMIAIICISLYNAL